MLLRRKMLLGLEQKEVLLLLMLMLLLLQQRVHDVMQHSAAPSADTPEADDLDFVKLALRATRGFLAARDRDLGVGQLDQPACSPGADVAG
jgi:hypothetical protein